MTWRGEAHLFLQQRTSKRVKDDLTIATVMKRVLHWQPAACMRAHQCQPLCPWKGAHAKSAGRAKRCVRSPCTVRSGVRVGLLMP